jgi:hypothetical protein
MERIPIRQRPPAEVEASLEVAACGVVGAPVCVVLCHQAVDLLGDETAE